MTNPSGVVTGVATTATAKAVDMTEQVTGVRKLTESEILAQKPKATQPGDAVFRTFNPGSSYILPNGERRQFVGHWTKTNNPDELKVLRELAAAGYAQEIK